ncbi:DUF3105 domain-containing protein [Saccharopolyspora sp. HNM0983]|uniref:DUF3105 domain-containing protein n=1 Tax=Saccharopolyspora montiporae TaxID=2781240 RepID=A0A929BDU1_9PSEU|nr:DUF3105 domain-containing protein [Saccharopolyspora sp. HNM0983]MBE9375768.1 DUF3105 domain-containing protein [Saccharopolyspora sp. HNM0983]
MSDEHEAPPRRTRPFPWATVAGVTAAVIAAGSFFGFAHAHWTTHQHRLSAQASATPGGTGFEPSPDNPDPSRAIPGVRIVEGLGASHVTADERVAYEQRPPVGGAHDEVWADCTGVVYDRPVREENLVHSLEHGAVWIAYDPARLDRAGIDRLAARADNAPHTVMSPYPGMDHSISLQSWGHQLAVEDPADERIDQFITALRLNEHGVYPEVGATCQTTPDMFDPAAPPPFDPAPPGPDAVPMNRDDNGPRDEPGQ